MERFPDASRPAPRGGGNTNSVDATHPGVVELDYLNVREYLRILLKRSWIVALIIGAAVLGAVLYNWQATRIFESTATVQIEADPNVLALDRPLQDTRDWVREFVPTQLGILESRELARVTHERLLAEAANGGSFEAATSPGAPASREREEGVPTVAEIVAGRAVFQVKDSRLLKIGFRSTDPVLAARVANALARSYVEQSVTSRSTTTGEASEWLTKQVEKQRTLLEASEAALQRYREGHGADALFTDREGVERQNIVVQKLADLQQEVTKARAETIQKESQYRQVLAVQGNREGVDTLPLIASNGYIQALKTEAAGLRRELVQASEELGERHPDRIKLHGAVQETERKLQQEILNVVESIQHDFEATKMRERALVAALEGHKAKVQALNAKAVEYTALEREATTHRDVLDKLLQRAREATLARQLQTSNIRIVDAPQIPEWPIFPRRRRNLVLAFVGSGALAVGLIFLLEIANRRMTSPDDVRRHLGIPVLGVAPEVKRANGQVSLLLGDGAPPEFAELVHGLRTSVVLAPEFSSAHTVLVTSSEPGEGKTVIAANLAVSLARLDQRVLLIDADLRKPQLHEVFGVEQQPGMTDVLSENATQGVFWKTKVVGLWLMPAGSASHSPADLLTSDRFGALIEDLRGQFDWIVLDSPPVLAVTDPCLIARVASGVVFVVGSGQTTRDLAAAAVERLNATAGNVVGVVLNRAVINPRDESYLPYYHRKFQAYHSQQEA